MNSKKSLDWIQKINTLDFSEKSILLIGAGKMGKIYAHALNKMGIKNVTVLANTTTNCEIIQKKYGFHTFSGDFHNTLPKIQKKDLVIIATPTNLSIQVAELASQLGQTNILIEKPASISSKKLVELKEHFPDLNIRVGYNRLFYPNFIKLKSLLENDGGISSCRFNISEKIDGIDFQNYSQSVLEHWGIENSSHIISMVFELIGLPQHLFSFQQGSLSWHSSGSIFVGHGTSKNNIPFSYVSDWNSTANWEIEIFTKKNSYKLGPLEMLFVRPKNSFNWNKLLFNIPYPDIKFGIAEEISLMLNSEELAFHLPDLKDASNLNKITSKIFGYDNN